MYFKKEKELMYFNFGKKNSNLFSLKFRPITFDFCDTFLTNLILIYLRINVL
jgi:hypothetical protein